MHRCRDCETPLQEGRNWHPSYAARTYRHCMECARAYSRSRYGRLKPGVKHRKPVTARVRAVRDRAVIAQRRRDKET